MNHILKNELSISISSAIVVTLILSLLLSVEFMGNQSTRTSDLLYNEQKPFSEIIIVEIDDSSINELGRWPWKREIFSNALEKLRPAKIIGVDVSFFEESDDDIKLESTFLRQNNIILVSECNEFGKEGECNNWLLPIFNTPHAAANIYVDKGIARSVPGTIGEEKSLSLLVSERYLNSEVTLKNKNYIYFHEPYNMISFSDVLNVDFDQELISDKIILIGATAKNLHDEQETPIGVLPGVEIHANAIQSILNNKFLNYQTNKSVIIIMLILSLLTASFLYSKRLIFSGIGSIALVILYSILSIFMFDKGLIMNLLYPISSIVLTYFLIVGLYYKTESLKRKWISEVFGKYVSPSVAKQIMKEGSESLHLKGSKKIVTSLFVDIRGFTAMSEKMRPERVVSFLNKYLEMLTDIVFDHGGTLDKYVGDEIMATYNVPLDQEDHALAAVKTAIDMQKASKNLGKIKYGIGINTGPAVVGNIGGKKRLDYTVIGDSVNLAARLCSACPGDKILISDHTYKLVKNKVRVKALTPIMVKGKVKPIKIYEVLGLK